MKRFLLATAMVMLGFAAIAPSTVLANSTATPAAASCCDTGASCCPDSACCK